MALTLSTDQVPDSRDRREYLRSIVRDTVVPLDLVQERSPDRYWGEIIRTDLPTGSVARLTGIPTAVDRTPQLIRESDPELYQVQMHLRGTSIVTEGDRQVVIGPGDVIVFDPSRPFQALVGHPAASTALSGTSQLINLMIPRSVLDLCGPDDAVAAARLSCANPMNRLAAAALVDLDRRHMEQDENLLQDSVSIVGEILRLGLARQLSATTSIGPETRDRVLLLSVRKFIEDNLTDPCLTPEVLAKAHHVSTRKLQRLFQREGTTVHDYVLGRRMERCRRDLLDPGHRTTSVASIAFRWGFRSESHFSRRFRATFGVPPARYRSAAAERAGALPVA